MDDKNSEHHLQMEPSGSLLYHKLALRLQLCFVGRFQFHPPFRHFISNSLEISSSLGDYGYGSCGNISYSGAALERAGGERKVLLFSLGGEDLRVCLKRFQRWGEYLPLSYQRIVFCFNVRVLRCIVFDYIKSNQLSTSPNSKCAPVCSH